MICIESIDFRVLLKAMAGMVLSSYALAQDVDQRNEVSDNFVLKEKSYYATEAMPASIAFNILSSRLLERRAITNNPDGSVSEETIDMTKYQLEAIASNTGFDEQDSLRFLHRMRAYASAIQSENEVEIREIVCKPDLGSWSPDKAINAYKSLDDIRQAVYAKHYTKALVELSAAEVKALEGWLEKVKLASNYIRSDYDGIFKDNPEMARSSLMTFCSM